MTQRFLRLRWVTAIAILMAVPGWAHRGFCSPGDAVKAKEHTQAEVGKPAPDFTLKDQNGHEHKLSDLKGKIVVLEWTNHQCPVVNRYHSSKTIPNTFAKLKDKGVVWLAIDSSNFCLEKIVEVRKWAKQQALEYPILLDPSGKVGHLYGAKTTPHMFVVDAKGVLAYMGSVDDDKYGDKETPRNYVEAAVNALAGGTAVAVSSTKPFGCGVKYKK